MAPLARTCTCTCIGIGIGIVVALLAPACGRRAQTDDAQADAHARAHGPRIASRTVLADELLWALGPAVQARVVGLSPMADDPRYSLVADRWPATTPRLGRNPEALLALAPQLVILASFSDVEYRAALEGKVETLVLDDFDGFAGYRKNLARIGEAVGAVDEAAALRERFDLRLAAIEAARPPADARPDVVAWSYDNVAGAHTSFDDAATAAGFRNLAAAKGIDGHQHLDREQLVAWGPRWLVIGCGERSCDAARQALIEQPGLQHLPAIEAGHVIAIPPPYLATTGEGMLDLAEQMQAALLAGEPTP